MKLNKTILFTSLTGALTFASFALAEEPVDTSPSGAPAFEELDKNLDGVITSEESKDNWLAGSFQEVDVNQDGYITKAEYQQATS